MIKKFFFVFIFLFLGLIFVSCDINDPNSTVEKNYTLKVYNNLDDGFFEVNLNDSCFKLADLPKSFDNNCVFLGYSINGNDLKKDEVYSISDNHKVIANFGIDKSFFNIERVSDIYLTCDSSINSKERYEVGSIVVHDEDYALKRTSVKIRLRGNSSLDVAKKSYKLKFEEKQNLLNMGKDKEWALIANYFDPSFLRNYYAYKLANAMKMEYSVEAKFVNVYLNNEYQGLYLLCETVKTSKGRVNIEEDYNNLGDSVPFMIEIDHKITESGPHYELVDKEFFYINKTDIGYKNYPIAAKYPKDFTTDNVASNQYQYIKKYMTDSFDSVLNGTYNDYLDLDSFIDYYLIQELFMNIDMDYSSVFMYKPLNEKLHFGPVWDFDISAGNCGYVEKYDPYMAMKDVNSGSYLFNSLINKKEINEMFHQRLSEIEKDIIPVMIASFEHNLNILKAYSAKDDAIWHTLDESNWAKPDRLVGISYSEQVMYLKNYLESHFYWMMNNM